MSCPFVGLATRHTAAGASLTARICGVVPYERNEDPDELPAPSVCFSHAAYQQCYHYRIIMKRKEIMARQDHGAPMLIDLPAVLATEELGVFEPEEVAR